MNLKRSYRSLIGGVWAGVLTTCLGLATVTVWTDTRDYERTIRDARSTAEAVVQALGQEANRLVSSVDMLLSAAAARVDAHTFGANPSYTRQLLSGLMAHVPAVMGVRVLDGTTAGVLYGQGGVGTEGRPSDAELVRSALAMGQSELAVGWPTRIGPADSWFVSVARLVMPRPGETPLVAVADLSLTELQRLYGRLDLGPNGAIGLLRSDGVILVRHPYAPDKVGLSVAGGALMRAAAGVAGGTYDGSASPIDGVSRYGSFQRVAGAPLLVTTGVSKDETLAAWREGVRQDAAVVLGISTVLVGLGFGLTRAMLRHRDLEAEARRAAGMLSAGEARYRLLAENTSELIVLAHDDGRRSYVSPAVRRLLGYTPEEVVAMRLRDCVHREDLALLVTQARRLAAGEPQVSVVCRARHRTGAWIWVEGAFRRIPGAAPGEPAIIATFRDVGERQRHARALEEARIAAERASQAKSDFLASMSHEIRTPLNGVIGYADLLLADRTLPGRHRRYVDRIAAAGGALLTVVDDILDFSRIEAGGIALSEVPFAPAALVDNAASIVRGLSEPKGLALDVALDPAVPDWVRGDPDRLRQILLNLLNNAVKFTPAGRVAVRVEAEGGSLRFCVSDTGIGIAPEQHGRLFQRFSQVDGSIRRQYGGSGLGLAICKGLVELMGGTIGVESRTGAGSTFWFRVPLPACPAPAAEAAEGRPRPVHPARLLLVEDVPINQDLARAVLEAEGHNVDVAGDGAAAIEAVRAKTYDLVLMDVQMPGMDGLTATRTIRAMAGPAGTVPIVAMTANVLPAQIETFRAAGMDGHVGKPFKRAELAAAIARHRADGGETAPVPTLVDVEAFAAARSLMGRERIDGLLGMLATELDQRFRSRSSDRAGLAHDAHAMISAAGLLGFTGLSDLCREIEEACLSGADLPDLQRRIDAARAAALDQIETLRAA
ncbi:MULTISPECIES: ATP-binding protein [Methylobacterium]|jgi:PAS domain S-box-containing protein|uniref:ATP-binding protein n=1 Tax=Methylobacterium TaxID=407 RepID=UPI0008EE4A23|nr:MULTISPECIES: ATP-binding protein [Methylobacterium]MBZ6415888.1 response regulator [Methylobacterium sp.]MBK3396395.1 response regulator [Methylobacterium ajmalii]MBK3410381.1 response regulator [Methylobacterium ajmalii]MBK3423992.1 response regulator [Methylobacterium ajmalii]SFF52484.1 PAS domain S-box-containing protein [Methylobacterium sp. yr596]